MGPVSDSLVEAAVDDAVAALALEHLADRRFRGHLEQPRLGGHVFGGQLLAAAVVAAGATGDGRDVRSLHASFVAAGASGVALDISVEAVRDGSAVSIREVRIGQEGRVRLLATVSLRPRSALEHTAHPAPRPIHDDPEAVPSLQHWARAALDTGLASAADWIERPPPFDLRLAAAPTFLGGAPTTEPRHHWLRVPRSLPDDAALHTALLAYASDLFLMDVAFPFHPDAASARGFTGLSLDHSLWIHRRPHVGEWHRYTQEVVQVQRDGALTRGTLHDREGNAVASVVQEVLVRPLGSP